MSLSLLDQLIPIIGGLYGIAFFGGYLKHSKTSPVMVWANTKYPKLPKTLVYVSAFVVLSKLILLAIKW